MKRVAVVPGHWFGCKGRVWINIVSVETREEIDGIGSRRRRRGGERSRGRVGCAHCALCAAGKSSLIKEVSG